MHGDSGIYSALITMSRNWSRRVPLTHIQGNGGSIVEPDAAASRYCVTGETLVKVNGIGLISILNLIERLGLINDQGYYKTNLEVEGPNGKWVPCNCIIDSDEHPTIILELENGFKIEGTENHPVLIENNRWTTLRELWMQMHILAGPIPKVYINPEFYSKADSDGDLNQLISIKSIVSTHTFKRVYSLRIDTDDHAYITNGIVSHNTECKLTKYSEDILLADLSKETVDFIPNYDDTSTEPIVLPSILPHILIQGNDGIGWSISAEWIPHNPLEVCKLLIAYVKNRNMSVHDVLKIMPGPDFPSGGIINGMSSIGATSIYYNGHGGVKLRGRYHVEETKKGKIIVITEIPWGVNYQTLLEKFVELHTLGDIALKNIQDETDKDGIRIVLIPKDDNDIDRIINVLYKKTQFEANIGCRFYAVETTSVQGLPKKYNILTILHKFITFRELCIHKKLKAELEKKSDRLHILKGLFIVNKEIEKCIDLIRKSNGGEDTIKKLCNYFKIDERQAKYIVDMKLGRLSGLDMNLTKQEETKLKEEVKVLTRQTRSVSNEDIDAYMINEWETLMRTTLKDFKRKTEIRYDAEVVHLDDTIKELPCSVVVTSKGYIKRTARLDKMQNRASMGMLLGLAPDEDIVQIIHTTTTTPMYAITNQGRAHIFKPHSLEETSKNSRGKFIPNLFKLRLNEHIIKFINHDPSQTVLALLSSDGQVKLTSLTELSQLRSTGKRICSEDLKVTDVILANHETDSILIVTKNGMGSRFKLNDIRISGVGAGGVKGIKLKDGDEAVAFTAIADDKQEILIISSNAFIKRCENNEFPIKSRGGYGVIIAPRQDDYGYIVSVQSKADDVTIITKNGRILTCDLKQIRKTSRSSKGVKAINLQGDDIIHSII